MQKNRAWTKKEVSTLYQGAGVYGLTWFTRRTGRSAVAVRAKAHKLFGGLSRGSYSLRQASGRTGYTVNQILRARKALMQKWKRTSPKGAYLIYEDQLDEITDWLRNDYWSVLHCLYGCLWCGTTQSPHYALGLCERDYQRFYKLCLRAEVPSISILGLERIFTEMEGHMNIAQEAKIREAFEKSRVPVEADLRYMLKERREWILKQR